MNEQEQTDEAWLTDVVSKATRRPCVVEFVRAIQSYDLFFGSHEKPSHWRVVIKGVVSVPQIDPARIKLRDDEYVRSRVLQCLPEAERVAS